MNDELKIIIEKAYSLFKSYRVGTSLSVCSCCVGEADVHAILAVPLRKLSASTLRRGYYESASDGTDLELHEMKHFLPRVLELIADAEDLTHSVELNLSRLQIAEKPHRWTSDEIALLNRFAKAQFSQAIVQYPPQNWIGVSELLVMYDAAGISVEPLLASLLTSDCLAASLQLHDFLDFCEFDDQGRIFSIGNAFAKPTLSKQVIAWLKEPTTIEIWCNRIENQLLVGGLLDDKHACNLSCTYEILKKQND
jgi:hypothetical protein